MSKNNKSEFVAFRTSTKLNDQIEKEMEKIEKNKSETVEHLVNLGLRHQDEIGTLKKEFKSMRRELNKLVKILTDETRSVG